MADPDLRFLGERIERIQAELRDLRNLRTDVSHFRAEASDRFDWLTGQIERLEREMNARFDAVDARFDAIDTRFEGIDGRFEGIDARFKGIDARFDQVHQTMATNLAVVLEAIKGLQRG